MGLARFLLSTQRRQIIDAAMRNGKRDMSTPWSILYKYLGLIASAAALVGLAVPSWSVHASEQKVESSGQGETNRLAMLAGVQRWVAEQSGVSSRQVEVGPIDGRLKMTNCRVPFSHDFAFGGRDMVRVRCNDPAWDVYVRARVREARQVVRVVRALPAGTMIEKVDVEIALSDDPGSGDVNDPASAIGRRLRVALGAGSVLRAIDLDETRRVYRLLARVAAGSVVDPLHWRAEDLARNNLPAGTPLQKAPAAGTRYVRDLPPGSILLQGDLAEPRQVLVARENIPAGRTLEKDLFLVKTLSLPEGNRPFIGEFAGLEFQTLTRNIPAGEALLATDLKSAVIVNRGQPVVLTLSVTGGLEVSIRTEAMEDGRISEPIRLRNPDSGKVLSGRVTGRGTARAL